MGISGLSIATSLVVFALLWAWSARLGRNSPLRRAITAIVSLPGWLWMAIGILAFALPVLEYWMTARSHANALAGIFPWADATEYYECAEAFLLGVQGSAHCTKRPLYTAAFSGLLWLSGNRLQVALLLQALLAGGSIALLARELARTHDGPAAVSGYAVQYVFASALCAALVMTENIGLLLGTLGLAVLWSGSAPPRLPAFLAGMVLLAAGLAARPGAMFVLPALIAWYVLYARGSVRSRLLGGALGIAAAAAAMGLAALPVLITGGVLGSTHSNFSYSLYGLAVGGKGWIQVAADHPEIFDQSGGKSQTQQVYELAVKAIIERPHMFLLGYVKGMLHYADDLFRYAEFKPLRLALLLPLWIAGLWAAVRRWREPRYAMLIALQAGIVASSPFISIDGQNRVFASTSAADALFVAMGMYWVGARLVPGAAAGPAYGERQAGGFALLAGAAALVLPLALFAAIKPAQPLPGYAPPSCEAGQEAIVAYPARGTLVLPLVEAGEKSIFPLRVRAAHFRTRFHRWVHAKEELALPAGTSLVWAIRLDRGSVGMPLYFTWSGEIPPAGRPSGFCVEARRPGRYLGTAASMHALP